MVSGEKRYLAAWLPKSVPSAVVIGVHGMNDYRGAFATIGPYLAAKGFAVYAYDQRGFGATPERGRWPGGAALVDDLAAMVRFVASCHPGTPIYLLGDSMGAAVVVLTMTRYKALPVEGIVLSAPALWGGDSFDAWERTVLGFGAFALPWLRFSRDEDIQVAANAALNAGLGSDPLVLHETRLDALYGVVRLMDAAVKAAPHLWTPTLMLYGLKDEVIPRRSICGFVAQVAGPIDAVFYDEGYHLLLRDSGAAAVWRDIVTWLNGFEPSSPVGEKIACRF